MPNSTPRSFFPFWLFQHACHANKVFSTVELSNIDRRSEEKFTLPPERTDGIEGLVFHFDSLAATLARPDARNKRAATLQHTRWTFGEPEVSPAID
jgi:hypothetical protein